MVRDIRSDNMISKCHTKQKMRYDVKRRCVLFNALSRHQLILWSLEIFLCYVFDISDVYTNGEPRNISHQHFYTIFKSREIDWLIERCNQKLSELLTIRFVEIMFYKY